MDIQRDLDLFSQENMSAHTYRNFRSLLPIRLRMLLNFYDNMDNMLQSYSQTSYNNGILGISFCYEPALNPNHIPAVENRTHWIYFEQNTGDALSTSWHIARIELSYRVQERERQEAIRIARENVRQAQNQQEELLHDNQEELTGCVTRLIGWGDYKSAAICIDEFHERFGWATSLDNFCDSLKEEIEIEKERENVEINEMAERVYGYIEINDFESARHRVREFSDLANWTFNVESVCQLIRQHISKAEAESQVSRNFQVR